MRGSERVCTGWGCCTNRAFVPPWRRGATLLLPSPSFISLLPPPPPPGPTQTVYGTDALLASHDRAAIMRPTSGVEGASMDTEYHYPGLHLDVDPQSYCSEDAHTEAAVRTFLDSLLYGDDR